MLQLEKVQKYYNSFLAIDIPYLKLEHGLWWLQGENGSGKTTFLKLLAGLHPFQGKVTLNEKYNIKKQRVEFLQRVNYAEAEPLYPSFLTPKDLVHLYCRTKRTDPHQAILLLERLNIAEVYEKRIGTFSSGMVKKVSLALAFVGNPDWVFLDEPFITIDVSAIDAICTAIRGKHKDGVSFIITSHQAMDVDRLPLTGKLLAANQTVTTVSYAHHP
jgi:ABC-2 type transport system ATP-binding protein